MSKPALIAWLSLSVLVSACGGGGDSAPVSVPNALTLTVGPGPANNVNLLFTTLEICTPGSTSNCQSIDHVLVDTGSSGLRILSSVLNPALSLQQQTDSSNRPLAECGQFVNGFTWGPVKIADIRMSQELARSTPIQLIGDPAFAAVPTPCSSTGGPPLNTAQALGANGVLGVSMFPQDCGSICANSISPVYFACPQTGCQPTTASLAQQLQNPVALFALNNNGVVIDLPSVAPGGAPSVNGSLIFGIGTQGNNAMANTQVIRVNPSTGLFTTVSNGVTYNNSFVDSGSNALYFGSTSIPPCNINPDFFCPAASQVLSATLRGTSGSASVNFRVANAQTLFATNPSFFAFSDLAGTNVSGTFDWGLPFFFGRRVYLAIAGQDTPAGSGPYVAF